MDTTDSFAPRPKSTRQVATGTASAGSRFPSTIRCAWSPAVSMSASSSATSP